MNIIAKIHKDIYRCVTADIITDDVILTNERLQHIKQRHPNDYELYLEYIKSTVEDPDYIIEANKPNSAVALKDIIIENNIHLKVIVRLVTSNDNPEYKNSVITFQTIRDKEWKRLLKNKTILYNKNEP
ncbi:PBECR2 nuclease fold domain-containing protein [Butyrivibrio fibrisolvens]|uniref:PBECR2 nuclease fold domain-containing protein n=1 Tax=Pseudobutyrivibrio ruminis TaxID=46206 RepID=UPI000481F139|nr:PBECR2 nuclease fold domain-containing protein [Pseudobutyrivibrio ruminis]MDC7280757.1 PBECR2 nuclease fold domain-containing protein [Butyrivibrio fibrisolvens]